MTDTLTRNASRTNCLGQRIDIISDDDASDIAARSERNRFYWAGRTCLTAEQVAAMPDNARVTNDERGELERREFLLHPPTGQYVCYLSDDGQHVTTWPGQILGTVTYRHSYRSNMGDTRVTLNVTGIDGRKYHGIGYGGNGMYARIQPYKNQ